MTQLAQILQPKFQFGQRVQISLDQYGYVCGCIYYSDLKQWHYAVSADPHKLIPSEVWYQESELNSR